MLGRRRVIYEVVTMSEGGKGIIIDANVSVQELIDKLLDEEELQALNKIEDIKTTAWQLICHLEWRLLKQSIRDLDERTDIYLRWEHLAANIMQAPSIGLTPEVREAITEDQHDLYTLYEIASRYSLRSTDPNATTESVGFLLVLLMLDRNAPARLVINMLAALDAAHELMVGLTKVGV